MTDAHKAYEATPEFQRYWAAMREAERLQGVWTRYRDEWPLRSPERDACYRAWRASCNLAKDLLTACRNTPEHRIAFGW